MFELIGPVLSYIGDAMTNAPFVVALMLGGVYLAVTSFHLNG